MRVLHPNNSNSMRSDFNLHIAAIYIVVVVVVELIYASVSLSMDLADAPTACLIARR